jgi:transposase-like protein
MDNTPPVVTVTTNSLQDAIRYFSDPDAALEFVASLRWPTGVTCPHCEAADPMFLKTRRIWKCRKCRKRFSVKVGTIFEDSAIGLDKWLPALWLIANAKNGISSYELHRALKVTQKTAWFMLQSLGVVAAWRSRIWMVVLSAPETHARQPAQPSFRRASSCR